MISCTLLCLSGLLASQPVPGDLERKFREGNEAARLELLQSLDTDDPAVAKQAIPFLIKALGDDSPAVRAEAATRLGQTAALGSDAIPALCKCLEDRDLHVRRRAVGAIGLITRQPEVAVPALRKALRDPDFEKGATQITVPNGAAIALGDYGFAARDAFPDLFCIMKTHEDRSFRSAALISLGRIGTNPDQVIGECLAILENSKEENLWHSALRCLELMGEKGKPAVPVLLARFVAREAKVGKRTRDNNLYEIMITIKAIEHDNPQFLRLLERILRDREYDVGYRNAAVICVGDLGMGARPYLPALAVAFRDDGNASLMTNIYTTIQPFNLHSA
jgi:HEAT repeat protein